MRRIVVTGIGTVNSVGNNVEDYFKGLLAGKSGITNVTRCDLGDSPCLVAGEVKDFDPEGVIEKKDSRKMDPFTQYGIFAAEEAIQMAGLDDGVDKTRVGVIIGSGIGGVQSFEENVLKITEKGHKRVSPLFIPTLITDITSGHVAIRHGFHGPNFSVSSACATANHALGTAFMHIAMGDADVMVAGGTEGTLTPVCFAGFTQARALSTHFNDAPEKSSRPFDVDRDGFVMGEGAGVLVLEEYEHAKARGAKILAEFSGYGFSEDAHHITAPHPEGLGASLAMRMAIQRAGIKTEDIDLINTHGTSTGLGDIAETKAIKLVFGEHAYQLKVNSTKSMTGHTLGAAGGVESVAVIKMLETGKVHPTINLDNPDPECDLDYVPHKAIDFQAEYALSNSFGFGGHNASLIFKRYEG